VFFALYFLVLAAAFVLGAEIIIRLKTLKPWRSADVSVTVHPGGRFYQSHPVLGYTHIPGTFTVMPKNGVPFNVSHRPNTLRVTQPIERYETLRRKEEIWIFGCSFTHGWGLNDEQTYPWRLQERFAQYEVVNFGVGGYGTIHSWLQLREALKLKTPKIIVLAYAGFHDERNTFLRDRRKQFAPWNKLGRLVRPYARLDEEGRLQYEVVHVDSEARTILTIRHSALIDFVRTLYYEREDRLVNSHAVSEALVLEMANLARQRKAEFIVAGIHRSRGMQEMLEFARKNGLRHVDLSVDPNVSAHKLLNDSHPSAIATQKYADALERVIRTEILTEDEQPKEKQALRSSRTHTPASARYEPFTREFLTL
jgi:hypothetical protein